MIVDGLELALLLHSETGQLLYPHQVSLWEQWANAESLLLASRTGTGKTRAAMLPILHKRQSAVAVYPTNELLRDQVRAVQNIASSIGCNAKILSPAEYDSADYAVSDCVLIPLDAKILDEWQEHFHSKKRGECLRRILNPDKPKIVFTNPDILFLIFSLAYHAEPLESLRRYETLVVDEFHLYQGVEFCHAIAMITLARCFSIFKRIVLLSATPPSDVQKVLQKALDCCIIDTSASASIGKTETRWAVHEIELTARQKSSDDPISALVDELIVLRPILEELRKKLPDSDYIPAVVVLDSVFAAIQLEDRLVDRGFNRDSLAIIRGLSHRSVRKRENKLLALGTSAIEVGVDFDCDYLLFEASHAASFLQRFGRVGRHREGRAIAFVQSNVMNGMAKVKMKLSRTEFEQSIYNWYPTLASNAWFLTTEHGMISARTMGENLVKSVANDREATPELIANLREKIDSAYQSLAASLGCTVQNNQAKSAFEKREKKKSLDWLNTYLRLNRFRTSLPSIAVHDFMEHSRRDEWKLGDYELDLLSLSKRGRGIRWNDKLGKVTISGIGILQRVHISEMFSEIDVGLILNTKDYRELSLYQDGNPTPVSDLLAREDHIFVVVPKTTVQHQLDWRIPVIESGEFFVAFDGAALLLLELYRKIETSRNASLAR
jgi:CRISPR-associated helicase Cas3